MVTRQQQLIADADLRSRLRFEPGSGKIWLDDQRMMLLHAASLGSLRHELIETLGRDRARGLLTRMGYSSGVRDARFVRRLYPTASDSDVYVLGPHLHNLEGIVNVKPIKFEMNRAQGLCEGEFIWEDSIEAAVHREAFGLETEPACWMQIGYACGYTSELFGRMVLYREIECVAKGDPHCRIVGKPVDRWPDADQDRKYFQADSLADRLLELQSQVEHLRYSLQAEQGDGELVGASSSFRHACEMVDKVAPSQVTVMLLGETGVGKEMFGRRIHQRSARAHGPFVAINCAAIPEDLIESELFGVEKGAFTGATRSRPGRFERAHGGTLFLDEVAELSAGAQAKLLRVLQEGEFERIGDTATRKVDVRLIVATNIDLQRAVDGGEFRADLFYRLNTYPVCVPPLRERLDDIPLLVERFVDKYSVLHGKKIAGVTGDALETLLGYDWPGNIRELQNIIERGVILTAAGEAIEAMTLFTSFHPGRRPQFAEADGADRLRTLVDYALRNQVRLEDVEHLLLERAVERTRGNLSSAARLLGITRPQLAYRLKKKD
ncbi:MAG: sigma 54-interacting transcriptional regulator [Gammaproteobacteria bacterium]|nr:sigma 54-interacting transcriptional regulator [Gammaproteobacteria bacterium]